MLTALADGPTIDTGNTAWLLASTALVLLMTPGLALFYGGLNRSKSVLNMMMMSFSCIGLISVLLRVRHQLQLRREQHHR
jgi:Amt family ammonium transporter